VFTLPLVLFVSYIVLIYLSRNLEVFEDFCLEFLLDVTYFLLAIYVGVGTPVM
jgi:hypothetical protein